MTLPPTPQGWCSSIHMDVPLDSQFLDLFISHDLFLHLNSAIYSHGYTLDLIITKILSPLPFLVETFHSSALPHPHWPLAAFTLQALDEHPLCAELCPGYRSRKDGLSRSRWTARISGTSVRARHAHPPGSLPSWPGSSLGTWAEIP